MSKKSWVNMTGHQKKIYISRVLDKFKDGKEFLAEEVASLLEATFEREVQFYRGLTMSVSGHLKSLGFLRTGHKTKASPFVFYYVWPLETKETVDSEPELQDKTAPTIHPKEEYEEFLKSSHKVAGVHQKASPEMADYYKGRKVAFQEALNIFKHMIEVPDAPNH